MKYSSKFNIKDVIYILLWSAISYLALVIRGYTHLHILISSITMLWIFSAVVIFYAKSDNYFSDKLKNFAYTIIALTYIGFALQCFSIENEKYIRNLLLTALLLTSIGISIYSYLRNKLNYQLVAKLSGVIYVLLFTFLVALKFIEGQIWNSQFSQTVLLIPVLYIITIAASCAAQVNESSLFKRSMVLLLVAGIALIILNELGVLMIIVGLHFIVTWLFMPKKYTIKNLIVLFIAITILLLLFVTLNILDVHISIVEKLKTRLTIPVDFIFKDINEIANSDKAFNEAFQIIQGRKSIAEGGLFGSASEVELVVRESDMAFQYLVSKYGAVGGVVVVALFIALASYANILFCFENIFEKISSVLFLYAILVQSFITILGSSGLLPFSGLPIGFLSMSKSYFVLAVFELAFIIYSSKKYGCEVAPEKKVLMPVRRSHKTEMGEVL